MGGGKFLTCWFSLNSSETVKAVTLAFCSIEYLLIRDIRPKFGITNSPQSLDIAQNSDGAIYDFQVSQQSFINKNCHNSRSSTDIDMKLKPVTKLEKRNTPTSKKNNKKNKKKNKLMMMSCWQIVSSLSFFWSMANLEQSESWFFINSKRSSYKNVKQLKNL